ncbi:hypothetical protein [Rhodopseudomonas palustris]|uniref:hypothetical protein n=1 Tax=Rhodopseudomonas palustris TaxID=1076 RepID=UPI001FD97346|nr:hypothetical protein [Rhodopseudomonas palustris]
MNLAESLGDCEFQSVNTAYDENMPVDRKVLVDNATLSGVERLIGESRVRNLGNVDNDILCLEKLLTAILFSDALMAIDDYKEEYRSKRSRQFSFIKFLKLDHVSYADLSGKAADFARSMTFSFDGSKPAGDVVSFFEALRIDPQLRWDVFVSSEYLTMSLLVRDTRDVGYENSIDGVFRNESANADVVLAGIKFDAPVSMEHHAEISSIKDLVDAFASNNPNFRGSSSGSLLARCIFGYGWAAERSYFYNAVAAQNNASVFLAPLRDAFCEGCCRLESRSQVESLLAALKSKSQATMAKIVESSGQAKFALKLPFFSAYLISICDNPRQCIEHALELRNRSEFRDCRSILHNLDFLSVGERSAELNRILGLLEQSCDSLLRKYGVATANGLQVSLSLGLAGISAGTSIKLDRLFPFYRNRPFSRLFRNIAQDMVNVERLGGLYEKLCASVKEHQDAGYPSRTSVTPKFMERRENEYGRPAKL